MLDKDLLTLSVKMSSELWDEINMRQATCLKDEVLKFQ